VNAPAGWNEITDYAAGKGAKPDCERAHQILEELLDAMALAECTYRPEVVSAVLRRPPLKIPAFGFGFRGVGESYKTRAAVPLPGFRADDLVTIRRANGVEYGIARAAADELLVSLRDGDWVAYEIEVRSPSRFQIDVALEPAEIATRNGLAVDISVDGTRIEVEDPGEATVRGTTEELSAGRHVVRLTGLSGDALVRWIEVVPEHGGKAMGESEERRAPVR
jgi:hypothetical protein